MFRKTSWSQGVLLFCSRSPRKVLLFASKACSTLMNVVLVFFKVSRQVGCVKSKTWGTRVFIRGTEQRGLCKETSPRCTLHSPRFTPPPPKHSRGSPNKPWTQCRKKFPTNLMCSTKIMNKPLTSLCFPWEWRQSCWPVWPSSLWVVLISEGLQSSSYLHTQSRTRAEQTAAPVSTCPWRGDASF